MKAKSSTLQEQGGGLREEQEEKEQEKRLLARLQSLCLGAGRRSQHEQQQGQNVGKSHEEILAQQRESERSEGARGSEVRRGLRLSFVEVESLENFGGIREEEKQRERHEVGPRSEGVEDQRAEMLVKVQAFQRELLERVRVMRKKKQCPADAARGSVEVAVPEVEACWTMAEKPAIEIVQLKGGSTAQEGAEEQGRASSSDRSKKEMWSTGQNEAASKRTRLKGNCTLGVRGSAWRCKRGAAWGKQLRSEALSAGKSSCGARETEGEGAGKSSAAQKFNETSSDGHESEWDVSGCDLGAADEQKRQQMVKEKAFQRGLLEEMHALQNAEQERERTRSLVVFPQGEDLEGSLGRKEWWKEEEPGSEKVSLKEGASEGEERKTEQEVPVRDRRVEELLRTQEGTLQKEQQQESNLQRKVKENERQDPLQGEDEVRRKEQPRKKGPVGELKVQALLESENMLRRNGQQSVGVFGVKKRSQHAKREKERGKQPDRSRRERCPRRHIAQRASKRTRKKWRISLGASRRARCWKQTAPRKVPKKVASQNSSPPPTASSMAWRGASR